MQGDLGDRGSTSYVRAHLREGESRDLQAETMTLLIFPLVEPSSHVLPPE